MTTKQEIIKKVSPLFLSQGFRKLKVDSIAEDLSISKKTLYKYFGNKENNSFINLKRLQIFAAAFFVSNDL